MTNKIAGFEVWNYQAGQPVNVVGLSGGKDSIAVLLLAMERNTPNLMSVFNDTGNEHPMTYEYVAYLKNAIPVPLVITKADFSERIRKKREFVINHWEKRGVSPERIALAVENLKPTGNPFLDLCKWKGRFPSTKTRFCTGELKVYPFQEQLLMPLMRDENEVVMWTGVRADESPARAKLPMEEYIDPGYLMYRPILHWTAEDCFAYTKKHGIKNNPLYSLGMGRVGCMPCVMSRKAEIREISNRFPEVIDRLEGWEEETGKCAKRGVSTFFPAPYVPINKNDVCPTCEGKPYLEPAEDIDDEPVIGVCPKCHGESQQKLDTRASIRKLVQWSRTVRGGKQLDIFADEAPTCSSIYGLCE